MHTHNSFHTHTKTKARDIWTASPSKTGHAMSRPTPSLEHLRLLNCLPHVTPSKRPENAVRTCTELSLGASTRDWALADTDPSFQRQAVFIDGPLYASFDNRCIPASAKMYVQLLLRPFCRISEKVGDLVNQEWGIVAKVSADPNACIRIS